jgi:acyl-CoA synthetase (AMP-forming)/AMP-acid ligase II
MVTAQIERWARQHVAGFKVPKDVVFVDDLPKGGTGKVLKHVLRAQGARSEG